MPGDPQKIWELVHSLMNFRSKPKDLNIYGQTVDTPEFKDYEALLEKTGNLRPPKMVDKEAVWQNIERKIDAQERLPKILFSRSFYAACIAASLILCCLAYFTFIDNGLERVKSNDVIADHRLPDGSRVSLNKNSEIVYDIDWGSRKVRLEGEAYFEVKEGKKFTVATPLGTVKVLGTQFNVLQREGSFVVRCKSGTVKVSHEKNEVILQKGEQSRLKKTGLKVTTINSIKFIGAFKTGLFQYDDAPLSEVFEELERQFSIELIYDRNQGKREYTGQFKNTTDLIEALDNICAPMGLTFKIENAKVIVE